MDDEVKTSSIVLVVVGIIVIIGGLMFGIPQYSRYQKVQDAHNEIAVNEMVISQTQQLVQVEKQKADIKVAEANGIAQAQKIINETLTDRY